MFGIGPWELAISVVIALIVIGPKKLPEIMRSVGKGLHELRKASSDFQQTIEREVHEDDRAQRDQKSRQRLLAQRMEHVTNLQADPEQEEGSGVVSDSISKENEDFSGTSSGTLDTKAQKEEIEKSNESASSVEPQATEPLDSESEKTP